MIFYDQTKRIMEEKHFYNNLKHELFKKLDQWKNSNQYEEK